MRLCSHSAVPEGPPATPGIQPLTQQLFIKRLLSTGYRKGHWGYSSEQTRIAPQGAYILGVSLQGLQAVLGRFEFPSRVPFPVRFTRTRAHTPCPCLATLARAHVHARLRTGTDTHGLTRARSRRHAHADAHGLSCRPPPHAEGAARSCGQWTRACAGAAHPAAAPEGPVRSAGAAAARSPAREEGGRCGAPGARVPAVPSGRTAGLRAAGSVPGHRGHAPFSAIPSGRPDGRRGQVR